MRVTIERLGHLGDGIAQGPVFVPGALPGELVEGRLSGDRLEDMRILTPSPHRRKPPCAHARTCGGCSLQHATDAFVAGWKMDVVRNALAGQGLEAEIAGIATSAPQSRRRATLAGRRGKSGVTVGFHMRGSDQLVPVPGCLLLTPGVMAVFPGLEAIVRLGATRKGELALTVTETLTGPDVSVMGGKPDDPGLVRDLASLAETHGLARLTWNGETVALRAQPLVAMGRARVPLPPGAFLQATAEGEAALLEAVRAAISGAGRVIDLFSGCGTFALPLAERAEVHAVEGDAILTAALLAGARGIQGLKALSAETRDLFRRPLLPDELRADAVVIDPPRAGAEAQVAQIARARVPVVAMVSCNPVTFARDARMLHSAGYRLGPVQIIDQFRWSSHVELAAQFALPHIAG